MLVRRLHAYSCWSMATGARINNWGSRIDLILVASPKTAARVEAVPASSRQHSTGQPPAPASPAARHALLTGAQAGVEAGCPEAAVEEPRAAAAQGTSEISGAASMQPPYPGYELLEARDGGCETSAGSPACITMGGCGPQKVGESMTHVSSSSTEHGCSGTMASASSAPLQGSNIAVVPASSMALQAPSAGPLCPVQPPRPPFSGQRHIASWFTACDIWADMPYSDHAPVWGEFQPELPLPTGPHAAPPLSSR